ncbi:MAG: methionyl-tRNA formyltransferase [Chitinophagaceae bacterium]|nr:methionyl-tRNA formyltransferase [Chitinophagaceae bacterium]
MIPYSKKESLRIVFFGTNTFAVESLKILVENKKNIVGVITVEDKPQGRGNIVQESPIKSFCKEHNINLMQPHSLKSDDFIQQLQLLAADIQIVVAFRMLPEVVWNMPPLGTFNLHASLLPKYRGAAPINWALINGETETGVTTFFLKHQIDTGDIIFQEKETISSDDNAGTLTHKLMKKGAALVLKTLESIQNNTYQKISQTSFKNIEPTHAPKIFTETCEINFSQPTESIVNLIRGLSPTPAAWTKINQKTIKIFQTSHSYNNEMKNVPGSIITDNKTYLKIATQDGYISILELQMEGKKKMQIQEFLRGNKI